MSKEYQTEEDQNLQAGLMLINQSHDTPALLKEYFAKALECYLNGQALTPVVQGPNKIRDDIRKALREKYDMMAVKQVDGVYYLKEKNREKSYHPIDKDDLTNIVTNLYEKVSGTLDGPHIDKILNTLDKDIRRTMEVPRIDNTIIEICPDYYWDTSTGQLTDDIPEGMYCARRLFDTPKASKNIVRYNSEDIARYAKLLKNVIDQTVATLEESGGDLPDDSRLSFISTWACNDHEIYMDILRMMASNFMSPKPFGSYILRGQGRNGKSVCVGLLHSILGTRNTTRISMSEINNWHKYLQLANTMMNAPDEEEDKALADQAMFKIIADHGDIELDIMRGQQPLKVEANFQIISPANHDPEWTGTGAQACIRRARIIPFEADLSDKDSSAKNFAQETFTPNTVMYLLGVILGIARYYLAHPFPDSKTMKQERQMLVESMVSYKVYYEHLNRYFGMYNKLREVFTDYVCWCKQNGFTVKPFDDFKDVFKPSQRRATSYHNGKVNLSRVYRMNSHKTCFHSDYRIEGHESSGSIAEMNDGGRSIVTELDNMYEGVFND